MSAPRANPKGRGSVANCAGDLLCRAARPWGLPRASRRFAHLIPESRRRGHAGLAQRFHIMALALSLPAVEARPANPPETRPARVTPWLEEALKRNPIEAAATIGDALAATNRVALSETRRLELAERYYATAL